uniref:FH2 domain-containing protein n=1 Tax=Lotharella globosa TaxID=91324 RepID=A0A7S4DL56_9EUKA
MPDRFRLGVLWAEGKFGEELERVEVAFQDLEEMSKRLLAYFGEKLDDEEGAKWDGLLDTFHRFLTDLERATMEVRAKEERMRSKARRMSMSRERRRTSVTGRRRSMIHLPGHPPGGSPKAAYLRDARTPSPSSRRLHPSSSPPPSPHSSSFLFTMPETNEKNEKNAKKNTNINNEPAEKNQNNNNNNNNARGRIGDGGLPASSGAGPSTPLSTLVEQHNAANPFFLATTTTTTRSDEGDHEGGYVTATGSGSRDNGRDNANANANANANGNANGNANQEKSGEKRAMVDGKYQRGKGPFPRVPEELRSGEEGGGHVPAHVSAVGFFSAFFSAAEEVDELVVRVEEEEKRTKNRKQVDDAFADVWKAFAGGDDMMAAAAALL